MNRITRIIMAALPTILASSVASAQWNVARFDSARAMLYTSVGLDPAVVSSIGAGVVRTMVKRDVQLSADAGIAAGNADIGDFRIRMAMRTSLVRWRSVNLVGSGAAITRGTENSLYRGVNFGAELGAALGVYRSRWFAAAEASKDKSVITHVKHSAWSREHYWADAKDGWYMDAGGTTRRGLAGGVTLGRAELMMQLGVIKSEKSNDLRSPVYASLGVGFGR